MTRAELVAVLRNYNLAVQSSVAPTGAPQAAVVGFAVTDTLEIIFDIVATSRKYRNLRADPHVALVIGWEHEITVQIEGVADVPVGDELETITRRPRLELLRGNLRCPAVSEPGCLRHAESASSRSSPSL